ncbi:hypothetical protein AAVH_26161 [Aphelenchoides avenae]|nr:hypothetical protein AAVH_26161 [Aphelenchus avenae]
MVEVASIPATQSIVPQRTGTEYWYVMYHEIVSDEAIIDHGKTHIDAMEDPPHFSTLRDLLHYAFRRRQLRQRRIHIEAVTSLTLFGQRIVAQEDRPRANTVYHVYFRRRRQFTAAELCSDGEASNTENEE